MTSKQSKIRDIVDSGQSYEFGPVILEKSIGEGAVSYVFNGKDKYLNTSRKVKIAKDRRDDYLNNHIKTLFNANHKNIPELISFGKEDGLLYSEEPMIGNVLSDLLNKENFKFKKGDLEKFVTQCSDVLNYLHNDLGKVYGDFKSNNIGIDEKGIYLIDFTHASNIGELKTNPSNGTSLVISNITPQTSLNYTGEKCSPKDDLIKMGYIAKEILEKTDMIDYSKRKLMKLVNGIILNDFKDAKEIYNVFSRQKKSRTQIETVDTPRELTEKEKALVNDSSGYDKAMRVKFKSKLPSKTRNIGGSGKRQRKATAMFNAMELMNNAKKKLA